MVLFTGVLRPCLLLSLFPALLTQANVPTRTTTEAENHHLVWFGHAEPTTTTKTHEPACLLEGACTVSEGPHPNHPIINHARPKKTHKLIRPSPFSFGLWVSGHGAG